VLANRGANGIDGVIATATGVALSDPSRPTVVLLGDVAAVHDASSLALLARRAIDLTIVVVDNDGGAIFEFLAQRTSPLASPRFEQLFGTPHGTDLVAVARGFGIDAVDVTRIDDIVWAAGVRLIRVRTDRSRTVAHHARIHEAVARSVT
jgi:2-succinyl-5-enolpyruvyl-6-hydroxy-3-cyclohexene-1-carboxylate synthase